MYGLLIQRTERETNSVCKAQNIPALDRKCCADNIREQVLPPYPTGHLKLWLVRLRGYVCGIYGPRQLSYSTPASRLWENTHRSQVISLPKHFNFYAQRTQAPLSLLSGQNIVRALSLLRLNSPFSGAQVSGFGYIHKTMQCVAFCVWLLSLSTMFPGPSML